MPAAQEPSALNDILLFLGVLGLCGGLFTLVHVLALRLHDPKRLLVFLLSTYLVSAAVASALSFWLLAGFFSSFSCYLVANAGAVVAGLFAALLYAFLGPATADRSLTAHILIHLLGLPECRAGQTELAADFSVDNFLAKRYAECLAARLILVEDGAVRLTAKGRFMARLYAGQIRLLGLDRRSQHLPSFPERR